MRISTNLRLSGAISVALLIAVASPATLAAEQQELKSTADLKRPNIVIIMADDLGYSDIGCYGSEINTPNLDRLASRGLRFTQFYNTSRCCPTRASLLTGLYAHQAGVGSMVQNLGKPAYQGYLNDRCVTIGEVLRPAGYTTLLSGKWHVGEQEFAWPVRRGFERSYALVSGGTNYWRLDPDRILARDDKRIQPPADWYVTDALTENAVELIDEAARKAKPFLLYLPYTAPHWPLHAHESDIARYRGKYMEGWDALRERRHKRMIELGVVDAKWPLSPRERTSPDWGGLSDADKQAWDLRMAVYAAQIDRMDQGIGRVLKKLDDIGATDNTLVVFLADNGGCHEAINRGTPGVPPGLADSFLSYGIHWANASNTPFRRYKHWVHEGGIASPLIAHWPNVIKQHGAKTDQVGHVIDLMATCVDLAGAEYPRTFNGREITPLEGKSLRPIFEGRTREPHEYLYWEHQGHRALRHGDLKLVARHGGPWELYDLAADRAELNNLATERPQDLKALIAKYDAWASRAGVEPWTQVSGAGKAKAGKAKAAKAKKKA
jgi:arylsulfatase